MVVHSTSDPDLPPEHSVIGWPRFSGRDLSVMNTWKGWLGAFVPRDSRRGSFAALYNPDADEGMVNSVTSSATDPVSGMPEFKVCAVQISREAS